MSPNTDQLIGNLGCIKKDNNELDEIECLKVENKQDLKEMSYIYIYIYGAFDYINRRLVDSVQPSILTFLVI